MQQDQIINVKFREKVSRSIVKAITHRVLIVFFSSIITFMFISEFNKALTLVVLTNVANMLLYLFHERVWNSISWGKLSSAAKE